jgi:hypothetical protein
LVGLTRVRETDRPTVTAWPHDSACDEVSKTANLILSQPERSCQSKTGLPLPCFFNFTPDSEAKKTCFLSQMSGPWASAATSAATVTHLKERLQRFSHTKGRRLPASRSLGPPHQARLPRSAPEFRPSDALRTHCERQGMVAVAEFSGRCPTSARRSGGSQAGRLRAIIPRRIQTRLETATS